MSIECISTIQTASVITQTTDAVERPMTLVEKLEQERTRLNKQANDDINVVSKENHAYQVGLIGGLTNAIDIVKQNSDWISVDERLPSDWSVGYSAFGDTSTLKVTHWMSLPKPPSEVQDD